MSIKASKFRGGQRSTAYYREKFFGVNYAAPDYTSYKNGDLEASSISNLTIRDDGGFDTRLGFTTAASIITMGHSIFFFRDHAQVEHLLLGLGNFIYDDGDAAGSPVLSYTGVADARAYGISFMGFFFYANGVDAPLKFDGNITDGWTPLGMTAPAAKPVATDLSVAGNLNGVYNYYYCYLYENAGLGYEAESAMSAESGETTVTNSQIQVKVTASSEAHVSAIRIYRQSKTSTTWQFLVELTNTTANYTDNISDADISFERALDSTFEGKPAVTLSGITKWLNRLWGWSERKLYWTVELEPEKWWSSSSSTIPLTVDDDTRENILLVRPYGNMLVIWTTSKIFGMFGTKEEDFQLEQLFTGVSLVAPRSVTEVEGKLRFLTSGGIYDFDGTSLKHVSKPVDRDYHGYNRGILDATADGLVYSSAFYDEKLKEYHLSVPTGGNSIPDHTLVDFLKLQRKAEALDVSSWGYSTIAFSDVVKTPDGRIYALSATDATYVRLQHSEQDSGVDITNVNYEMRWYDFKDSEMDKRGQTISVVGVTLGPNILVEYESISPSIGQTTSDLFYLDPQTDVGHWDDDTWDDFQWASKGKTKRNVSCAQRFMGEYLRLRFSADGRWGLRTVKMNFTYEGRPWV